MSLQDVNETLWFVTQRTLLEQNAQQMLNKSRSDTFND